MTEVTESLAIARSEQMAFACSYLVGLRYTYKSNPDDVLETETNVEITST